MVRHFDFETIALISIVS